MSSQARLPNGKLLLELLNLSQQRLNSGSKAAISLPVLLEIIMAAVSTLPFDEEFYLSNYDDVRDAHRDGKISDLKAHFIEQGYFEGRFGSRPNVEDAFYMAGYPDVVAAIAEHDVDSVLEHYMRAGAAEGRFANEEEKTWMMRWLSLAGKP